MQLNQILEKLLTPERLDMPENDPDTNPEIIGEGGKATQPPPMPKGMEVSGGEGRLANLNVDRLMGNTGLPKAPQNNPETTPELTMNQRKLRHLGRMADLMKSNKQETQGNIKTLLE